MKVKSLLLGILLFPGYINSQPLKYSVNSIPEDLKKDVNAVIRLDEMIFEIESQSKAKYKVHQVITILNSNAKRFAQEAVDYDNLRKVEFTTGNVFDANGLPIKKLKSNEIVDQSAFDGVSLFSDNRYKSIDLTQPMYPYTVEIEYEVEFKFLFYIPSFYLLSGEKVSVEKSRCELIYPKTLEPRVRPTLIEASPVLTHLPKDMVSKVWSFENIKPVKLEPLGPPSSEMIPHLDIAPSTFEYSSYIGKMDTWDNFGLWISDLNKGRNLLPEGTQKKIKSITANARSTEEKVHLLYEYMQGKTRYVSIQLGIGGFQPFEASVVDRTGYGDCKALSNYMVSMLDVIGIKANYVLINAGSNARPMKVDFPATQFNHAIAAVPNGADTIWLECTSQTNPFGYQGKFTGNRKALLITDNGAKPVNTLRYSGPQNVQRRSATVSLDMAGNATAKVKTTYTGLQYENDGLDNVLNDQFDEQKKWIQENTSVPSFDVVSFKMENQKSKIPTAVVSMDLALKRLSTVNGKRFFLTPNLMNRYTFIPEKVEERKSNVVIKTGYVDYDTIHYQLPDGIHPEFIPDAQKETSRFGEYEATYTVQEGKLIYIRKMIFNNGTYPPESYNELIEFSKKVAKADNIKLVFVSKT